MIWSYSVRKRSLDPAILYAWRSVLPVGADAIRQIAQHPYSDSKNQPSNDRKFQVRFLVLASWPSKEVTHR